MNNETDKQNARDSRNSIQTPCSGKFIVSTYGFTSWGAGHDTETKGKIKDTEMVSIVGGLSGFIKLLETFVEKNQIERGESITITISQNKNVDCPR